MDVSEIALNGGIVLGLSLLLLVVVYLLRFLDQKVEAHQLESSRRLMAATRERAEERRRVADEATRSATKSEA